MKSYIKNTPAMDEQFIFKKQYRIILIIIMGAGLLITFADILIFSRDSSRIWANILLNNQFFLGIALGAAFFLSVHLLAWSGWHTAFQRLPFAMTTFIPVAFVLMLLIYFGMHDLYHWSNYEGYDAVLENKKIWLNVPFFFIRLIFYFTGWIALTWLMRKNTSLLTDSSDIKYHIRRKIFAGLFLVFYAITVSTSSWDWIMSLDAHWYSTIFGWYLLIGMFVTSLAFITILIWVLKRAGYLKYIRPDHVGDLSTLLFSFSIFWTYLWFSQYLLIWYGHLPEETIYYIERMGEFRSIFYINLGINFVIPFFGLMNVNLKRKIGWVTIIASILLAGHWIDYYQMIMPAAAGKSSGIGMLEIFMTVFYAGLFLYIVLRSLSAGGPLVIKNDPFLEESLDYES